MAKQIKSYRDLDYNKVVEFASKRGLNTDTHANWREVAIAMFNEMYGNKRKNAKPDKKCIGCGRSVEQCICSVWIKTTSSKPL